MSSIDNSNQINSSALEHQFATNNFNNSMRPGETGVIPNNFNNMGNMGNDIGDPRNSIHNQPKHGHVMSELSGQAIGKENFHNNQVPFIAGGVKQNTDMYANQSILERHTGSGGNLRKKKTEVKSFFDTDPNMGKHVNGMPIFTERGLQNRFFASRFRQGEKIIQDVKVGSGLNNGLSSEPEGGFHNFKSGDFARAQANRLVNNRAPNNPKISYSTPLKPGALKSGSRGLQAMIKKNRPDRYYVNSPDRYFKNGGHIKASKLREKVNAKATQRQNTHRSYFGGLLASSNLAPKKDQAVRKSRKNNYKHDGFRNLHDSEAWQIEEDDEDEVENFDNTGKENFTNGKKNKFKVSDYGASSVENKPNERDITQNRTHSLNLTTNVKKIITPVTDLFRKTKKENAIGNIRPDGNFKASMPYKMTVHDPDDVTRTTKKEMNIHNNHEGFLKGEDKTQVVDYDDVARTTKKEMNIHNKALHINLSPQQPDNLTIYDPEDIAKTTLKEMTEDKNHLGFVQYEGDIHPGGYLSTKVKMKNTHKQFLSDYYYNGNADGDVGKGGGRGYLASKYKAKHTNKQFLSDYEYSGIAGGGHITAKTSYADKYNARLNPNRQIISQGRAPTEERVKLTSGGDFVNISHKKIESDRINVREPSENKVYQAPPQMNGCGMTTVKQRLPENTQRSRIDVDILNAFRENPYTKPLTSAV